MRKKLILITGASSGIGEACAWKFAENGCRLILNARSEDKLLEIKEKLQSEYGTEVLLMACDVRDGEAVKKAIDSLPEQWRDIDVLVNNAGLALGTDKEHELDLEEAFTMIDTNVKALLRMTRLVVPGMVNATRGTSSTLAQLPAMVPILAAASTAPQRLRSRCSATGCASTSTTPLSA